MRAYARIQKFCFYGGLIGLVIMIVLLLFSSNADFVSAYNSGGPGPLRRRGQRLPGRPSRPVRQAGGLPTGTRPRSDAAPDPVPRLLQPVLQLGRDALRRGQGCLGLPQEHLRDGRRPHVHLDRRRDPAPALRQDVRLGLLLRGEQRLLGRERPGLGVAVSRAARRDALRQPHPAVPLRGRCCRCGSSGGSGPCSCPRRASSSRRPSTGCLPEWVSRTSRNGVPYAALLLMLIPSIPISYMYAFGENFATYVLDAVLVIAITFLGSAVSAALMPWLKPDIYNASPIARYNVLGHTPDHGGGRRLRRCSWSSASTSGSPTTSTASTTASPSIYMLILYAMALAMYVGFRLSAAPRG